MGINLVIFEDSNWHELVSYKYRKTRLVTCNSQEVPVSYHRRPSWLVY
jgi:hypothetical protein